MEATPQGGGPAVWRAAMIPPALPIRQIAYFVPDVRIAAAQHSAIYGSGPYFVNDHIPLRVSLHRGVARPLDHSSAYGQWGPLMVEFVQQNNAGPSAFHDLYPAGSGRAGIHHVAIFVENIEQSMRDYLKMNHAIALYAEMNDGFAFAMIDTVSRLGHMVELYEPTESLTGFYAHVAAAAAQWDGHAPVRDVG